MMKIFFAVAVFVLAVSAYKYSVPPFPCEYELKLSQKQDGKNVEFGKFNVKGRYMRMKAEDGDDKAYAVYRYDITEKQGGMDMIGLAAVEDVCETTWYPLETYVHTLDTMHDTLFSSLEGVDWSNKETKDYDGKKCTVYHMGSIDDLALYVYDDFPYAIHLAGSNDTIYEWEWEVSLDKFKVKDCGGKFAETPDEQYAECGSGSFGSSHSGSYDSGRSSSRGSSHKSPKSSDDVASSTQAFAAVVFGVIAACLVALF